MVGGGESSAPFVCEIRVRGWRRAQVNADEFVLAAGVEASLRQRRMSADHEREDLRPLAGLEAGRSRGCLNQLAALGHHQQLVVGDRDDARLQAAFAPAHRAGLQLHAAQFAAVLLPAVEAVEKSVVMHRRCVMGGQHFVARPEDFGRAFLKAQQRRARAVAGRNENLIANHQRRRGAHGRAHRRTPAVSEHHFAIRRVQCDERIARDDQQTSPAAQRRRHR